MENEIALSTIAKRVCETYERESDYTEKLNIGWLEVAIKGYLAAQSAMRVDVNEVQITAVARVIANIVGAPYDDYRHFTGEAERCLRAAIQAAIGGQ